MFSENTHRLSFMHVKYSRFNLPSIYIKIRVYACIFDIFVCIFCRKKACSG